MRNVLPLLTIVGLGLLPGSGQAAGEADEVQKAFDQQIKPFFKHYCSRCHNADKRTSGISLDHLTANLEDGHIRTWEEVSREIATSKMPPEDARQPTAEERKRLVEWIERGIRVARLRPVPKNGLIRRLTVAQYRNTLRELLLLEEDLTEVLPPDAVSRDGFVNNKETLQLSPLLLEAYMDIAEKALQQCIVDPKSKPTIQNFKMELGLKINPKPCPDHLILGADSHLLNNADFIVTEPRPTRPFAYNPFVMRTKYRFIEGYQGNDTVRGWREYDSIYHAVYACMRGTGGYPRGKAYETIPQGLLLRPAIPSAEIFGVESTYGPRANFKIALRELPDHGRFRVTVTAARYNDGLLLDAGATTQPPEGPTAIVVKNLEKAQSVALRQAGLYQVDVQGAPRGKDLTLQLGDRSFNSTLTQPAYLVVRLPAGDLAIQIRSQEGKPIEKIVLTPLPESTDLGQRFVAFEKRNPLLGVSMGFRRDCGSTLAPVGTIQTVTGDTLNRYVFEGSLRNYPYPDVEKDNVNYLAGVREIGVHSEYTDGRERPRLLIRLVEFEGPYYDSWPPQTHRNLFPEVDHPEDEVSYSKKIIRDFATRAYRRPITAAEEANLIGIWTRARERGLGFQDSIKETLQLVLVSPQFLFLIENSPSPAAEPIDDYELASKLSYFLWNGPPDGILLQKAQAGTLRQHLAAEVDRMIQDPRFSRFTAEFAAQWLALDKFQVLEPDRNRFPRLTRDARAQLRQEPIQFLQHLLKNNLPAKNLIASDFMMANEITASYYDLLGQVESGYQFVSLNVGSRKDLGGLFSQAAILAGLSDGREANPVKRGAWVARRILAEPPDDPPPNVPTLKEDTRSLTLRQRLEKHRSQPGCAQCHAKIDPYGVAFEEYDAGGRFRKPPPDARSTLPDQKEVANMAELKQYLSQDRIDQVAYCFLKHLAIYATGRNLSFAELEQMKTGARALRANDYRLQEMVKWIVQSPMFLEK